MVKNMTARFPHISKATKDILMITGSSVASESTFLDCDDLVTAERAEIKHI